ncbi:MAG TPA: class I SAM-dependent methyltransferase [Clostridia bacterium]|nr:class I SAM-dependent methyltransferase [Clostridia bacterium]
MSWQKNLRMDLGYRFFGNSFERFFDRGRMLKILQQNVPPEFLEKDISDLGCGDGLTTQRIAKALKAKSVIGYEFNKFLLNKAEQRGLSVKQWDLDQGVPTGELAVIWGVIHHLEDQETFLKKLKQNFRYAVIREPLKRWHSFLDGGEPKAKEDWIKLFNNTLGDCQFIESGDNIYVFWKRKQSN